MAMPLVVQSAPQRRASSRSLITATPRRVAIRSLLRSSSPGCTPTSQPHKSSRRPCVRRRLASCHGLSEGHPSPSAASTAAAKSVASHTGFPVAPSKYSAPDGLQGVTGSRP